MRKYGTGYSGVLLLMALAFGLASWLQSLEKVSNTLKISIDFKSSRQLEYQELMGRQSLPDYFELDDISADLSEGASHQKIGIKALPDFLPIREDKVQQNGYRLRNSEAIDEAVYLFSRSQFSEELAAINRDLIESKFLILNSDWQELEVNGQVRGSYLKVRWANLSEPLMLSWRVFCEQLDSLDTSKMSLKKNILFKKIVEKHVGPERRNNFWVAVQKLQDASSEAAFIGIRGYREIND